MNIPGFSAEASLYNGNVRYRVTTEATVYGGNVQPAFPFSDRINPDRPVLSIVPPGWGNCLKRRCWLKLHGGGLNEYTWVEEICRWETAIC
jgi:hypothetical protein